MMTQIAVYVRPTPAVPLDPKAMEAARRLADELWGRDRPRPANTH